MISNNRTTNSARSSGDPLEHVSEQVMEYLMTELVYYASQSSTPDLGSSSQHNEEAAIVAAERTAAKIERMGYAVGYRLTERLALSKTWTTTTTPGTDAATAVAAQQLEAVKFLCKEFWTEIYRKQIDKLQTNHRGVFVLKDLDLKWLSRFPIAGEESRVWAIRVLAFPCGLIRGCLANLGIPAVVSCDFLADGHHMSACSFNIKVK
jgi:trafficking protein particle complex subunit 6